MLQISAAVIWLIVLPLCALAQQQSQSQSSQPAPFISKPPFSGKWATSWASVPQLVEPTNLPPSPFTSPSSIFPNTTLRQTIHVTASGSFHRLRISNVFGGSALPITRVTVAVPLNGTAGSAAVQPGTVKQVTFAGGTESGFVVPNGALVVSDPFEVPLQAQGELSVSLFLEEGQSGSEVTGHPVSMTTSWAVFGDHVEDADLADVSATSIQHWYFISTLDTWVPTTHKAFIIVGDSITDGIASTTNGNNRWPDRLLARLQASPNSPLSSISFGNEGDGGNRILLDGLGPNALGRFDRDVLAQQGVAFTMLFEGVNDIGTASPDPTTQQSIGDSLIAAFRQIATRAHAAGLPIFGGTITPFSQPGFANTTQPYSNPIREQTRQRVNAFIRTSGVFDAVVDFDAVVRDAQNPAMLAPMFNSGDFLHPSVAGYQAMADAFPVDVFERFAGGVSGWA